MNNNLPFNVFAAACPSRTVFEHIFSRWSLLILARLHQGTARFGELRRDIDGISERMLSKSLKILEQEKLVVRRDFKETPPRVEYRLTNPGRHIAQGVLDLIEQLYKEMYSNEDRKCLSEERTQP